MPDPVGDRGKLGAVMRLVEREVEAYLDAIDTALVRPPGSSELPTSFPSEGAGTMRAVSELIAAAQDGATKVGGSALFPFRHRWGDPRCARGRLAHVGGGPAGLQLDQLAFCFTH
jgi:hypothetical protein